MVPMGSYGDFLNVLSGRLAKDGFTISRDVVVDPQFRLEVVAAKTQLSILRNSWCHAILVTTSDSTSIDTVKQFSSQGWNFSMANKPRFIEENLGKALPPGQIRRVRMVAIPTIVSDGFGDDVKQWIVNNSPPHHSGDEFEFPVLVAISEKKIYHSQKASIWGRAYIKGVRELVQTHLGF